MNRNSSWSKGSCVRIAVFAVLVYAYFCAPISIEHKAFVQATPTLAPRNALADGYNPRRDPERDLAEASAEAKKSNKNIFVVVGGEWCTWCRIMDSFFREHPDLETLRDRKYVSMKVSMSQENPNRAFLSRFPRIHGYPHIFILNPDGDLIRSQPTNELEDGRSYNVVRFKKFLEQYAPKNNQ